MELNKFFTTVDKIITSGQILVFEVFKQLSWYEYSYHTKLSRLGLAGLTIAAILDFQMSIYQPFEELQGSNWEFKFFTPPSYYRDLFWNQFK